VAGVRCSGDGPVSISLALLLALYPLTLIGTTTLFIAYRVYLLRQRGFDPVEQQPPAEANYLSVEFSAATYALLFCFLVLWALVFQQDWASSWATGVGWLSGSLLGGFIGLAWVGIWLTLYSSFGKNHSLRRAVPALGAALGSQIVLAFLGAFSEELWRVTSLSVLTNYGYSRGEALALAAIAFAVAYLAQGPARAVLAFLEGGLLGFLFLQHGTFFAPFFAHLVIQAVFMCAGGRRARRERFGTGDGGQPGACPACGHALSRTEISLGEGFDCPACRAPLSVSETYRRTFRWLAGMLGVFCCYLAIILFVDRIAILYVFAISLFAGIGVQCSAMVLIQALFMPRLQYGDSNFVTLHLDPRRRPPPDDAEAP